MEELEKSQIANEIKYVGSCILIGLLFVAAAIVGGFVQIVLGTLAIILLANLMRERMIN